MVPREANMVKVKRWEDRNFSEDRLSNNQIASAYMISLTD